MNTEKKLLIFLVDDDALFLKLLNIEFENECKFEIKTFATGELCLANIDLNPDIIILDYHLNGIQKNAMNGIQTLDKINEHKPDTPVIILSSQDKIEVAIECMHHKAVDYVVKSETSFIRIQNNINRIFNKQKIEKALNWYVERM